MLFVVLHLAAHELVFDAQHSSVEVGKASHLIVAARGQRGDHAAHHRLSIAGPGLET